MASPFVDVLVPVALDHAYSYRVPRELELKPGDIVSVPLGAREALGVVWADNVEIKPGLVHSQTYTAYQGSITNEVRHFLIDCLRMGEKPLSTLEDAITAQRMIEACEESIRKGSVVKL